MILNRRHLKEVIREAREAVSLGADIATCKPGIVKPGDIQYRNGDVGLPLPFLEQEKVNPEILSYDTRLLLETLLLIRKDKQPNYLQKAGVVPDDRRLVNVGAVIERKNENGKNEQFILKKPRNRRGKGKHR